MAEELDEDTLAYAHRMFDLARSGETGELAANVDQGLPVNMTNDKGDTLLILAAYHDHAETVKALVDRGADTSRVNDRGQTALACGVFRQSESVVKALLDAGSDPELGSPSAIGVAQFFDLPAMSQMLHGGGSPIPDSQSL